MTSAAGYAASWSAPAASTTGCWRSGRSAASHRPRRRSCASSSSTPTRGRISSSSWPPTPAWSGWRGCRRSRATWARGATSCTGSRPASRAALRSSTSAATHGQYRPPARSRFTSRRRRPSWMRPWPRPRREAKRGRAASPDRAGDGPGLSDHEVVRADGLAAVLRGARGGLGDQPVHPLVETFESVPGGVAVGLFDGRLHLGTDEEHFLVAALLRRHLLAVVLALSHGEPPRIGLC